MNARTPTHNTISRESLQESATIAENHRWSCPNTKRGTQKTFSWKCHNFNPAYPCLPLQRNIIGPLVNKKTFLSPPNPTPLPLPSSSYLRLPPPGLSRVLLPLALRREGERGREEEGWKNDHHDLLSFSEGGIWFSPVLFLFLLFFFQLLFILLDIPDFSTIKKNMYNIISDQIEWEGMKESETVGGEATPR